MSAMLFVNCIVILFCISLLKLHIKLLKSDFTTFEYINYNRGRRERLKKLKKNEISQAEFDYEEKIAFKKRGTTKRSKIIRDVKTQHSIHDTNRSDKAGLESTLNPLTADEDKDPEITIEDLKKLSWYHYCTCGITMCAPCTRRV
jgi:hypothetical protein